MKKLATVSYALLAYFSFLGVFVYLVGFVGNFAVPKTIDVGPASHPAIAFATNLGLVALFGLQHSIMARPGFKQRFVTLVPASIERSSYVLLSSLFAGLLIVGWQPIPMVVWEVESETLRAMLWALFGVGWLLLAFSTLLIDHFDLFGLRQAWLHVRERAYRPPDFRTPLLYRHVRHPIYLGWTLAFFASPTMSLGHLLFATSMLGYMLIAIRFEERDLLDRHAEYEAYRRAVPMLIPGLPTRWTRNSAERQTGTLP